MQLGMRLSVENGAPMIFPSPLVESERRGEKVGARDIVFLPRDNAYGILNVLHDNISLSKLNLIYIFNDWNGF